MASCKDCVHVEVCCEKNLHVAVGMNIIPRFKYKRIEQECKNFKDRSRFVELNIAKKIKHTPDIDKMREFHKLELGKGMGERSIFWTCSNCKLWVSLAHKFCPNCGAKFEAEQALKLKERENDAE